MAHEEIDYVTPAHNEPPANDVTEILRGLDQRLVEILSGIQDARRYIGRLAASKQAAAIRELAAILGEHGDAQHVARHALEALAAQLGSDAAPTHRDLEAVRRRPRLSFGWWHAVFGLPGLALLVAGALVHDAAKAPALIAAGTSLLVAVLGNSFRRRSG